MSASKILKEIKEKDVQYVDVRFTDTRGRLQHVTFDVDLVDEDFLTEGTMFDGSSIAGWKAINESDMLLKPDLTTAYIDPFYQQTTMFLFCDVLNPDTGEPYNRDSRSMAKKALSYVQSSGVGDQVFFGPEAEFFIFDDVRWSTQPHDTGYSYDSTELPANTGAEYAEGNMGHRPGPKGGYFPVNPVDSGQDLRGEMLGVMRDLGLQPEKHHHEVAPAQHELGLKFSDLLTMADRLQLYKYVIHNVAHAYGKSATFMAKPMFADNGSGMHVHMSI
ncbi:MAG TPA: glutamine synthetase, partial [Brevundimonas sp.]|nr:glutamine synthetase [Brevundimonas sp.]